MNKKFEELELKDDFMFGIIMRNPKYCKPFLETILNIKISYKHKYGGRYEGRIFKSCCSYT
ncbi:hypothetical protein D7V86_09115 [bacterium D16-51]|nr:hypothetical protein D7V96_09895 [bacterium D16-59]RKI60356.1 hypothetical protein D7V86_09115 [bacterium D16-51]